MANDDPKPEEKMSRAAEMVRKALTVGIGAAFMTEESVRHLVSEIKLPKELLAGILEQAGKTKNDFFSKLSTDIIERIGAKVDPTALLQELLTRNEVELSVRIRMTPKKTAESPEESGPMAFKPGKSESAEPDLSEEGDSGEDSDDGKRAHAPGGKKAHSKHKPSSEA